jgi:hypothetical protein
MTHGKISPVSSKWRCALDSKYACTGTSYYAYILILTVLSPWIFQYITVLYSPRKTCTPRNPANLGGGGRGGRLAPAAAGRGPPPPGSPIASRISVHHNVPSPTDSLLETFLQVSPTTHTHRTTVDVAIVKKVTEA